MATPPPTERTVRALGARRAHPPEPATSELIQRIRAASQEDTPLVAVFDAEAIAGERHILSAWAHLGRSRRGGGTRLRDRGAELALYVAGDDQLGRALAKVGVSDRTRAFVLVAERPRAMEELMARFGLEPDPTAYPRAVTAATLDRLGITETERATVPVTAWEALVLERIALVDLSTPPPSGSAGAEPAGRQRRKG